MDGGDRLARPRGYWLAAEREINHLLANRADLQARLAIATGHERSLLREQIAELRYVAQLEKAGLDDAAIALRLEERRLLVARQRAQAARGAATREAEQFARGAGLSAATGGRGAIAGIALAATVGVSAEAVRMASSYAKELQNVSEQLGLTTYQTQVYQAAAQDAGVSVEQFRSSIGQMASYLGRARAGGKEEAETFKALGIEIKNLTTAGQALPIIIDRLSQVKDAAARANVEQRLFGEEGIRLDSMLSGGIGRINEMAVALERTGSILSSADIARLDEVAKKLDRVKAQLTANISGVVADNADAIIGLANSFSSLVTEIRQAIHWIDVYNSQKLRDLGLDRPFAPQPVQAVQAGAESVVGTGARFLAKQLGFDNSRSPDQMTPEARAFIASLRKENVPAGKPDTKAIGNLNAPNPPKGKSAERLADEADRRTRRFEDTIARYEDERLRAIEEQTSDEDTRRDYQRRQIEREAGREIADLRLQARMDIRDGADAKLTNARLAQAEAAAKAAAGERIQVINLQDLLSALQRRAAAATDAVDLGDEILRNELSLATTTAERKRIELLLLENARKRETIGANLVLDRATNGDPSITRQDIDGANRTLATQDQRFGAAARTTARNNESPLEAYRRQLHEATDDTNEALERIKVSGLQRLEDELANTVGSVLGLKGAFGDLVSSILVDLARLEIKKGILSLLGESGGGGIIGSVTKLLGGRASGGNVVAGTPYIVGERGPELFAPSVSGRIHPNLALSPAGGGGGTIRIEVGAGEYFDARVAGVSGPIASSTAVKVFRAGAPGLVSQTLNAAPAKLSQTRTLEG